MYHTTMFGKLSFSTPYLTPDYDITAPISGVDYIIKWKIILNSFTMLNFKQKQGALYG